MNKLIRLDTGETLTVSGGRRQPIKYTRRGKPYVTFYGRRYNLELFMRTDPGSLKRAGVDGVHCTSAFSALLCMITDRGETAIIWYQVT